MNLSSKLNKFEKEIQSILNCTRQAIYYYKINKTIPKSKDNYKKIFIASKGKIKPNDFFPLDEWKKELLTQKGENL